MSAVDAQVGKHLFQKCIREHLNNSAVILVTHQLQYLREADLIIVLKQGRIQETGTFQYLTKNGLDFSAFLKDMEQKTENVEEEQFSLEKLLLDQALAKLQKITRVKAEHPQMSGVSEGKNNYQTDPIQSVGNIDIKVYLSYFRAGGNWFAVSFFLFINIFCQTLYSGSDIWLTYWTKEETRIVTNKEDIPHPAVLYTNYSKPRYTK